MRTFIKSQLSALGGRLDKILHIPKLALGVVDVPGTRPRSRTLFNGREDALCQFVLHQFAEHLRNGVLSCPDCEAVFLSKVVSGGQGKHRSPENSVLPTSVPATRDDMMKYIPSVPHSAQASTDTLLCPSPSGTQRSRPCSSGWGQRLRGSSI
jgi:hypothetical protein